MQNTSLIDLDIPALHYYQFISSWIYYAPEGTFLVDPGPACTVDLLCQRLREQGIDRLDWILLTHIHLDHAGSIGHLAERFPEAGIVCHERAISHLIDPSKLWEGSLKTLGEVAETYGRIKPVPRERLSTSKQIPFAEGIEAIDTPGHAPHHLCFAFRDLLFVGELFGVFYQLTDSFYLRPATPPRFIPHTFLESMDRTAPYVHRQLCFGHYGTYPKGSEIAASAKQQLQLWISVVRDHFEQSDYQTILADLMDKDPLFNRINRLEPKNYQRELFFAKNAINGIYQSFRDS